MRADASPSASSSAVFRRLLRPALPLGLPSTVRKSSISPSVPVATMIPSGRKIDRLSNRLVGAVTRNTVPKMSSPPIVGVPALTR
jgi:hypothetical protein